ncbi:hypothetical protein CKAN_00207700 [Cinnamomum micranthum f. kanehirae]|uniref:Uncharacterized protein n=1 Tax=Cinnamomum micranthum f. kanehirae TaxID=337451 RepID=A0A443N5J2_9MAGN|nr:hypothetical protein CKAN_00207700 [Cinnamomum micranthum f. kanehirae]
MDTQRSQIQHKTHEFDEFNRKIMIMIASLQWNSAVGARGQFHLSLRRIPIGEFLRNDGPSLTLFGAHALPDASQVATAVSLLRSKSVRSLLGSLSLSLYLFLSVMSFSWKSVGFQGDKACF